MNKSELLTYSSGVENWLKKYLKIDSRGNLQEPFKELFQNVVLESFTSKAILKNQKAYLIKSTFKTLDIILIELPHKNDFVNNLKLKYSGILTSHEIVNLFRELEDEGIFPQSKANHITLDLLNSGSMEIT